MAPDPETTQGLERLLQRGTPATSLDLAGFPSGGRPEAAGTVLVGRGREVDLLVQRWQPGHGRAGGLVVVSGEPASARAGWWPSWVCGRRRGAVVAKARCFGRSGRLALAPVAEWLRNSELGSAVARSEPVWQLEIERLVPDMGTSKAKPAAAPGGRRRNWPGSAANGTRAMVDAWQRHRFFEGLARAVLSAQAAGAARARRRAMVRSGDHGLAGVRSRLRGQDATAGRGDGPLERDGATTGRSRFPARPAVGRDCSPTSTWRRSNPTGTGELARRSWAGRSGRPRRSSCTRPPVGTRFRRRGGPQPARPDQPGTVAAQVADLDAVLRRRLAQASPSPGSRRPGFCRRPGLQPRPAERGERSGHGLARAAPWTSCGASGSCGSSAVGTTSPTTCSAMPAYASITPPRRWLLHRRLAQGSSCCTPTRRQRRRAARRAVRPGRATGPRLHPLPPGGGRSGWGVRERRRRSGTIADAWTWWNRCPPGATRDEPRARRARAMSAPLNGLRAIPRPRWSRRWSARPRWRRAWASPRC